jgi:putative membrane-bound dehydrogenase-like protein
VAGVLLWTGALHAADDVTGPLEPAEALKHFQLEPGLVGTESQPTGLEIQLVAAEPDVIDPVAVRFDEDGRMWVVEMRDYPHGPAEGEEPQSRIKILEDREGDGRYEHVTVFADKLLFATGVQPWMGGAFVTLAGRVAYMKDTDGDGRADLDETWYTGFAQENSQLRANHPRLGLDGWIYIANGLRGGAVVDAKKPGEPLSISGMDFRFDPFTRQFEAISGVGQFGLTFDEFGNRFTVSNRNPLKHIVLEDRYLKKNPRVAVPAVFQDVAAAGEDSRIYPISQAWTTSTLHAGQFTAACGVLVYRGEGLPGDIQKSGFTCDPTGSLVHREILEPDGASFKSKPARVGVEFLASPDEWFRPVNLELGPEGAIYVVDMYRAVIEHPQFMPDELKRRPDLRHGDDRGRIYRIVPKGAKISPPAPLSKLENAGLVAALDDKLAWRRESAARLLIERSDDSAVEKLRDFVRKGSSPTGRALALWVLERSGNADQEIVFAALDDPHPRVREQAVVVSESLSLPAASARSLRQRLLDVATAEDADARLRFQVALSGAPLNVLALRQVAIAGAADPWLRRAVCIASGDDPSRLALMVVSSVLTARPEPAPGTIALLEEASALVGASPEASHASTLLSALSLLERHERLQRYLHVGLLGLSRSAARRRVSLDELIADVESNEMRDKLLAALDRIATVAGDREANLRARVEAVELLGYSGNVDALADLSSKEPAAAVRIAAIAALARTSATEPWRKLAAGFRREPPAIRGAILDGLLANAERSTLLLDEIAAERIKPGEIDRVRTDRLLKYRDAEIRARAAKLLADAIPADRQQVLADYQRVLAMKADAKNGLAVFQRNCANCHRIGEIGINVAPDIADSRTKTPAQILTDVLQPNRAIDANYVSYNVATADGRVLTGILTSETATSITLRQPEGKDVSLLRDEVEELQSSGQSLMPEGLEKNIDHQQMADLIAFIKHWRYLDGTVPLGKEE